jgi:hypothetical protein
MNKKFKIIAYILFAIAGSQLIRFISLVTSQRYSELAYSGIFVFVFAVVGYLSYRKSQTFPAEIDSKEIESEKQEVTELLKQIIDIKSFEAVALWDQKAQNKIEYLRAKAQNSANASVYNDLIDKLESWIERTPNTHEEATQMISELMLGKEELKLKSRELSQGIKGINISARKNNALTSANFFVSAKSRQVQRAMLRLAKEGALNSKEPEKAIIDRQILEIDKIILWVEKIK